MTEAPFSFLVPSQLFNGVCLFKIDFVFLQIDRDPAQDRCFECDDLHDFMLSPAENKIQPSTIPVHQQSIGFRQTCSGSGDCSTWFATTNSLDWLQNSPQSRFLMFLIESTRIDGSATLRSTLLGRTESFLLIFRHQILVFPNSSAKPFEDGVKASFKEAPLTRADNCR